MVMRQGRRVVVRGHDAAKIGIVIPGPRTASIATSASEQRTWLRRAKKRFKKTGILGDIFSGFIRALFDDWKSTGYAVTAMLAANGLLLFRAEITSPTPYGGFSSDFLEPVFSAASIQELVMKGLNVNGVLGLVYAFIGVLAIVLSLAFVLSCLNSSRLRLEQVSNEMVRISARLDATLDEVHQAGHFNALIRGAASRVAYIATQACQFVVRGLDLIVSISLGLLYFIFERERVLLTITALGTLLLSYSGWAWTIQNLILSLSPPAIAKSVINMEWPNFGTEKHIPEAKEGAVETTVCYGNEKDVTPLTIFKVAQSSAFLLGFKRDKSNTPHAVIVPTSHIKAITTANSGICEAFRLQATLQQDAAAATLSNIEGRIDDAAISAIITLTQQPSFDRVRLSNQGAGHGERTEQPRPSKPRESPRMA